MTVVSFLPGGEAVRKDYRGADLYEMGHDDHESLFRLVEEIAPDVIHAHSHKGLAVQIGRALGIPVVITSHHSGIVCPAGTLLDCRDRICTTTASHRHCLRCVLRNTRGGLAVYPLMRLLPRRVYLSLGRWLDRLLFILFVTPIGGAARHIAAKAEEWRTITTGVHPHALLPVAGWPTP